MSPNCGQTPPVEGGERQSQHRLHAGRSHGAETRVEGQVVLRKGWSRQKADWVIYIYIYTYTHIIIVFKDIPKNIYIHIYIYDYIGFVLVEHGGTIDLGNHGNLWEIEKVNDGTSIYWHCIIYAYIYIYLYLGKLLGPQCDLTGIMVNKGNHHQMAMALIQVSEIF